MLNPSVLLAASKVALEEMEEFHLLTLLADSSAGAASPQLENQFASANRILDNWPKRLRACWCLTK
ncbi:MAG: hypothetical protein KA368_04830 [Acidobacteria bacterium]|nr:hypothetical protein [Acidobacteriota bacterium]